MIYVASSWRNAHQPNVVRALQACGHEVYDFRHPEPGDNGFHWSDIDPDWQQWRPLQFRQALDHPIARDGFAKDMDALRACDTCVLVMPCGRSAHLELGYAVGAGKRTCILLSGGEPELMYAMVDRICVSLDDLMDWAGRGGVMSGRAHKAAAETEQLLAENWNLKHSPGTSVIVTEDDGSETHTTTRSKAILLGGHTAVVWLDDRAGGYSLRRVRPAPTETQGGAS